MSHARLTHPDRSTLEFVQPQKDSESREAVVNIAPELGTDRPALVHTETQEAQFEIDGRLTAPGRARDSTTTDEWRQALSNAVTRMESHIDEFQGTGYTLENDIRDTSTRVCVEGLNWSMKQGNPYEVDYSLTFRVGRGTFEAAPEPTRTATVNDSLGVAARVDGVDLPGMREIAVNRSVGLDVDAVFNRTSAENNDVLMTEGVQHRVTFEGTHTGTHSARASADAALKDRVATKDPITFDTAFPGYSMDGYVLGYDSDLEYRHGESKHHYALEFIEGERA